MDSWWSILKRWFSPAPAPSAAAVPDAGWEVEEQERCRIYQGRFVIFDALGQAVSHVSGRIIEWPGLPTDVYLRDPPFELRHHAKGPCLQLVSQDGPWFKLHWQKPARDFGASRAYVEQLLDEAFQGKQTR
jgi:hypothetical protein